MALLFLQNLATYADSPEPVAFCNMPLIILDGGNVIVSAWEHGLREIASEI